MATEQEQICITIKAEADLSSYQYRVLNMTNSGYGTVALHSGTQTMIIGVLQNKPAARDRAAKVCVAGHTKVIAGAAISTLGFVGLHSDGAVQADTTVSHNILGQNLTTAAGSGEYVEMILNPNRKN